MSTGPSERSFEKDVPHKLRSEEFNKSFSIKQPESKTLFIPCSDDQVFSDKLEEAITSKEFNLIYIEKPAIYDYYTVQKLLHKLKQNNSCRVVVYYKTRFLGEIKSFKEKIDQTISSGAKISSVLIELTIKSITLSNEDKQMNLDPQYIDLLFYLTSNEVKTIQSTTSSSFTTFTGELWSGTPYTFLIRTQGAQSSSIGLRFSFEDEKILERVMKINENELAFPSHNFEEDIKGLNQNLQLQNQFAKLEDVRKVIRFFSCAQHSLESEKMVTLKKLENEVIPVLTIGTGTFLGTGLWEPVLKRESLAFTGIFSKNKERVRKIYSEVVKRGESLEYIGSYDDLMNFTYFSKYKPIFYTLSIPGTRKYQEMADALKAGFYVLAEKPAFANADDAKKFRGQINNDLNKRLFFGWHYQHHYCFKKLWKEVEKNTFGNIKHIKTYFSIPKILDKSRLYEPSQGGVGLDIFSYNLHATLRLIGFNHILNSVESKIKSSEHLDPSNPDLKIVDFIVDAKLDFDNGTKAELYATFENTSIHHSTIEITFEDKTKIFYKEFQHVHDLIEKGECPILIQRPGLEKWDEFITLEDKNHPDYKKTTYDHQIEFIERITRGEETYDMEKDIQGLSTESNIKLHEILDEIFLKGGFEKKKGATKDLVLERD